MTDAEKKRDNGPDEMKAGPTRSLDGPLEGLGGQIGPFRIERELGRGAVGVVYLAHDTKLDRQVAIKSLSAEVMASPKTRSRFSREAKVLASLNHPNIATIHEVLEEAEGVGYLVLEYVPGKTLAERIAAGPLKLQETLTIALQIAEAMAAAHERDVIHRDLKPGNIKITPEGKVKVLDFGLAKAVGGETLSQQSTITQPGRVIGTPAYMSPEQARGRETDKRSDIWSFGCVLYEMLSSRIPFKGETISDTLANVLQTDPEWEALPPTTPANILVLLRRCLTKDPRHRLRDIGDALIEINETLNLPATAPPVTISSAAIPQPVNKQQLVRVGLVCFALGAISLAAIVWFWFGRLNTMKQEAPPTQTPFTSYSGLEWDPRFSPDGKQLAFSWCGEEGNNFDIYVNLIGGARPLRLTTHPAMEFSPAWSPDGRRIAFLRELPQNKAAVLLVSALGGPERLLIEIEGKRFPGFSFLGIGPYLTWSRDGEWLVIPYRDSPGKPHGLFKLSIETGEKYPLTFPPANSVGDTAPAFSPDGRTLAFVRLTADSVGDLYSISLSEDLTPNGEAKQLTFSETFVNCPVWTPDGHEIIFSATSDKSQVQCLWRISAFETGARPQLIPSGEDGWRPTISPAGDRLAYAKISFEQNIWCAKLSGPGLPTGDPEKLISSSQDEWCPRYSPNASKIAFCSNRYGYVGIYVSDSDGSNVMELTRLGGKPTDIPGWSPDGKRILFHSALEGQFDIFYVSANGGAPKRLTKDPATDIYQNYSRDGNWIYFTSNRSGEFQVWKMPAEGGDAVPVTQTGGMHPCESPDGEFLYYTKGSSTLFGHLWKVPVKGGEETQVLEPLICWNFYAIIDKGVYFLYQQKTGFDLSVKFFDFSTEETKTVIKLKPSFFNYFDISADGKRILYVQGDDLKSDLMLVENFR